MATSGGNSIPSVVLAGEVSRDSHAGAVPVTSPSVHTSSAPARIEPVASVTISDCRWKRWQIQPLSAPTPAPIAMTTRIAVPNDQPLTPTSWMKVIEPAEITAPTDRSRLPISTTSVWPSAAMPSSDASTSSA